MIDWPKVLLIGFCLTGMLTSVAMIAWLVSLNSEIKAKQKLFDDIHRQQIEQMLRWGGR